LTGSVEFREEQARFKDMDKSELSFPECKVMMLRAVSIIDKKEHVHQISAVDLFTNLKAFLAISSQRPEYLQAMSGVVIDLLRISVKEYWMVRSN